jgi:peptidoglycan/xylan/chitin deacetylase (PgdA/CDA1 family)
MMVQPPKWTRLILPGLSWQEPASEPSVYLTFDDGPIPEITPWVLDRLDECNVKATFFCVGENVMKHPQVYHEILKRGHRVGNHTFNHLSAWNCSSAEYFNNIALAEHYIKSNLFRPPHGKLFPWQILKLKRKFKKIVMWDVLTYDFVQNMESSKVLNHIKLHARNGSIIVFHDSLKAREHLENTLVDAINHLKEKGFQFKLIE